jgi:hypothetical protein
MDIEGARPDESEVRGPSAGVGAALPRIGIGQKRGRPLFQRRAWEAHSRRRQHSDLSLSWLSRHSHIRYPSHCLASQLAIPHLASRRLSKESMRASVPPEATRQGGVQSSACGRKLTNASATNPYALRSTSAELMPPNPNEFDTTTFALTSRPEPGTKSRSHSGSGVSSPTVGGIQPR